MTWLQFWIFVALVSLAANVANWFKLRQAWLLVRKHRLAANTAAEVGQQHGLSQMLVWRRARRDQMQATTETLRDDEMHALILKQGSDPIAALGDGPIEDTAGEWRREPPTKTGDFGGSWRYWRSPAPAPRLKAVPPA